MPGEYAEMMLNGDMCEGCGEWLGGRADGFPRYCSAECRKERRGPSCDNVSPARANKPFACSHCQKRFRKEVAVKDHLRDAHGVKP